MPGQTLFDKIWGRHVIADLGDAIFRDPETGAWQTDDAYLSGHFRDKLRAAEAAAALDIELNGPIVRLRSLPHAAPGDETIYRYDRDALVSALRKARTAVGGR